MKGSSAGKNLRLALALALVFPGVASGERKLPDFRLNSTRISGLPYLPDGAIPTVPPPTDTGYYSGAKAGGVRLNSLVRVTVNGAAGRAEIDFPAAPGGAPGGFRSSLFVKFAAHSSASVLSWAAVVCSGREYLGYKGASLKFPDSSGGFVLKDENLALGPMKTLLGRTHPWLIRDGEDGDRSLDRLCSPDFPRRMKTYAVKALPREANGYRFHYDAAQNQLTVSWSK